MHSPFSFNNYKAKMDVPKRVIDFLTELSNPNCYLPVVLGRIARAAEEDARLQELYTQAIA
jgi:hypothetical protein